MNVNRYVVWGERTDHSNVVACDLHITEGLALVKEALSVSGVQRVGIEEQRLDESGYVETTPFITLDAALRPGEKQPDDALTRLFRSVCPR